MRRLAWVGSIVLLISTPQAHAEPLQSPQKKCDFYTFTSLGECQAKGRIGYGLQWVLDEEVAAHRAVAEFGGKNLGDELVVLIRLRPVPEFKV